MSLSNEPEYRVGIVGGGFVGTATAQLGQAAGIQVFIYDTDTTRSSPGIASIGELCALSLDLICICVPSPMTISGTCDTSIVEGVVRQIRRVAPGELSRRIVIRSTVPPSFFTRHTGEELAFWPEFLTEAKAKLDFTLTKHWIVGSTNPDVVKCLEGILRRALKHSVVAGALLDETTPQNAAMVKYARNCFLATKVAFCNEIARACEASGCNYREVVAPLMGMDRRIGHSHTLVPGPDGVYGFGGTCFPKDLAALIAESSSLHIECPLLEGVRSSNNLVRTGVRQ